MARENQRRLVIILLMLGLLMSVVSQTGAAPFPQEGQITIVFDFGHDQPLSIGKKNFTEAIHYFLNFPEYAVRILENREITAENLSRSHILVIPNPGRNYSNAELEVITNFAQSGGALFLLGDYQVVDRPIGNPEALNQILMALSETRILFTTYQQQNDTQGDSIIDPVNSIGLPYNVQVNNTEIISYPNREIFGLGIENLLVAGGSLNTTTSNLIISKGATTAQAVSLNGEVIQNQPPWLAAFWIGQARIVLCTSTTMFSSTLCAGTNSSWFQSADNELLWYNIFRWMSSQLVIDPTPIMIFFVALVLISGTIILVYTLLRKRR